MTGNGGYGGAIYLAAGLICATLLLNACTDSQPDNWIRMGLASAPMNLDPRYATDATSERINRLLYQRLVVFDEQSMPSPGIANWERLSPHHYRLRLNDRAGWFSHGRRVVADDVVATYRYVLDEANASPKRSGLLSIERVQSVDELTVDFILSRADPLFPAYLTLEILPAELVAKDHEFAHHPVGSGVFTFHGWPAAGRLQLKRRDDEQLFEFVEVKNPTVRVLKLLRGEIDLLQNDISPELIGHLESQSDLEITRREGSNFTYIGFNLQDRHTGDPRVRQAIAHAIDRRAIIEHVMQGAARQAEALLPPEHWAGALSLPAYAYDPQRAISLISDAGYTAAAPLRLIYKTSSDPFRIRLATVIQSQLKAVGIEVELRSYDWGTFFGDIKGGNFQLYSLSWVGIRTPDIFSYIFDSESLPPAGANRGRYTSERVDRLLKQAETANTLKRQAALYQQIQRQLHQDLPYLPLWYEAQISVSNRRISGYRLMRDGNYDGLQQVKLTGQTTTIGPEELAYDRVAVAH